jgi:pimeloyl-ACP methyl ester carboxylesterase
MLPLSPSGTLPVTAIEAPAHVLTGSADRIVAHAPQGKALARLVLKGRVTEIEGAGHMLHHTHPHAVLAAVRDAVAPPVR